MGNNKIYEFNGFRLDEEQSCLWRDEELVSLTPKAYKTLEVLVKNQGKVISKNTLLDAVWENTFVEEATLAQNISTLRKTLSTYEKDTEIIATVPRLGYRFVANVTEIVADEEVLVVEKHSVTQIVAEQEQIHSSGELSVNQETSKNTSSLLSRKALMIGAPIIILALIITILFLSFNFGGKKSLYSSRFQNHRMSLLFSAGDIRAVTASPDGKYVAVVKKAETGDSILLKQVEDGNSVEVLPTSNLIIIGAGFSPKGEHIYYSAYKKDVPSIKIGKLYRIPILGGGSKEILKDIDSPPAISADGKKIAFVRNVPQKQESVIVIADIDGTNEKQIATRKFPNLYSTIGVSWSPDDKILSTSIIDRNDDNHPAKIALVDTKMGKEKPLATGDWLWTGQTSWLKDGSGIAFVAYGNQSPNITDDIWFASHPDGKLRHISNGVKGLNGISLTGESDSIIVTRSNNITGSFVSSVDNPDDSVEIAKTDDEHGLLPLGSTWTRDNKIVYSKNSNGNADIWIMNSRGEKQKQLTANKYADFSPVVSAAGEKIFFVSNRSGKNQIWSMNAGGENQTKLTDKKYVSSLSISQNNDFIYYIAKADDKPYTVLWRSNLDGSNPKQLTARRTYRAKISPDGKYLLCFFPDVEKINSGAKNTSNIRLRLTLLSSENGDVVKQFDSLQTRGLGIFEWKKNSKNFFYVKGEERTSLWLRSIESETQTKLKEWKGETIYEIAVSKDGKRLFYKKGTEVNSILQLEDFQKTDN